LRLPDRTQTSHQSTHVERAHENSVPGRADPPQANQEVDLLQARRVQNQANQTSDSIEGLEAGWALPVLPDREVLAFKERLARSGVRGSTFLAAFSATMHLMWDPALPSGCTPASTDPHSLVSTPSTCTSIPVPLSSVTWHWSGGAINTLANQPNGTTWLLNTTNDCPYKPSEILSRRVSPNGRTRLSVPSLESRPTVLVLAGFFALIAFVLWRFSSLREPR